MSYLDFYEMNEEPFSNAPVSRFFYNSAPHSKALVRLMYSIDSMKGLAVLIGEIGSGKTTLARKLLETLPEDQYEASLLVIIHSGIDAKWLLKRVALQLGVENPEEDRLQLLGQLYRRLVEINESGRKPVVLIDEAQMLHNREVMEEFRGLLNLELPERKLLNIVFFGLPELDEILNLDPPLAQRISVKYRLGSLDSKSTEAYIKHRLRLAGAKRMLFTIEAVDFIYQQSRGIPRLINTICDNALFEGYMVRAALIDQPLIRNVCVDLGLQNKQGARPSGGGMRAEDFVTPRESQGQRRETEPSPLSRPIPSAPPPPPSSPSSTSLDDLADQLEEADQKAHERSGDTSPSIDEIDGILDSLIDKV